MNLFRQSTMVVLVVPFMGTWFAAGITADLLSSPLPAAAAAMLPRDEPSDSTSLSPAPTATLLDEIGDAPPAATVVRHDPRPITRPVPHAHIVKIVPAERPVSAPHAVVLRNHLTSDDGTLGARVGVYTDCSGNAPLSRVEAAIDTCIPSPTYFVGHNAGVFSPLMHMGIGSLITYYDGNASAHVWRVVAIHGGWDRSRGRPPAAPGAVAQFQTCTSPDGSFSRILDVAEA
jgi:hypothetical protein